MSSYAGRHRDGSLWRYDHPTVAARDPRVVAWWNPRTREWRYNEHHERGTLNLPDLTSDEVRLLVKPTCYGRNDAVYDRAKPARRAAKNQL